MASTKHKDIEIYISGKARPSKTYESAMIDAVSRSIINGRRETITVFAFSSAAARWWDRRFGGDSIDNYKRDPNKPIDKISVSAKQLR